MMYIGMHKVMPNRKGIILPQEVYQAFLQRNPDFPDRLLALRSAQHDLPYLCYADSLGVRNESLVRTILSTEVEQKAVVISGKELHIPPAWAEHAHLGKPA